MEEYRKKVSWMTIDQIKEAIEKYYRDEENELLEQQLNIPISMFDPLTQQR